MITSSALLSNVRHRAMITPVSRRICSSAAKFWRQKRWFNF